MTIGTPVVISQLYYGYYILMLSAVVVFGVYDIFYRRVPNRVLAGFIPFALLAPIVDTIAGLSVFQAIISSLAGAVSGFAILLTAALTAKDGQGIGGGDIKLAAVLGFIYGVCGIITVLLIASLLTVPVGFLHQKATRSQSLRLPFVPFLTIGCFVVTLMQIINHSIL